VEDVKGAG